MMLLHGMYLEFNLSYWNLSLIQNSLPLRRRITQLFNVDIVKKTAYDGRYCDIRQQYWIAAQAWIVISYLQHVFATRTVGVSVCTFVNVCLHVQTETWHVFSLQPLDYTSYRSSGSRVSSRASSARASPVVSLPSPDILLLIPGFKSH